VTTNPQLVNLTRSIRPLPDGRAVCFGAAGPRVVDGAVARMLSHFSTLTTRAALLRRASGAPLSGGNAEGQQLKGVRRLLVKTYRQVVRREANFLLDDALRAELLAVDATGTPDGGGWPTPVKVRASSCDGGLRTGVRRRLVAAGAASHADIDYCLAVGNARPPQGANRNLGLLATAGARMIWIEDAHFVGWVERPEDLVDPAAADVLAAFAQFTGCQLADLSSSLAPAEKPALGQRDWWQRYRADSWVVAVQAEAAQSDTPEDPPLAVSRIGRPALVAHPASAATQLTGLDNRRMLPPFPPDCGPIDGAWGRLVGLIYPSAVVLALPFTVNAPVTNSALSAVRAPVEPLDVLSQLLRTCSLPRAISDPQLRLTLTGRHLVACGRLPDAALRRLAVPAVLDRAVRLARSSDAEPASIASLGSIENEVPDNLVAALRELLVQFGTLLMRWPGIWRVAARSAKEPS
jgi:hypothetical protein